MWEGERFRLYDWISRKAYTVLFPPNPTMMRRKQLLGEGNQERCLGSDNNGEVYAIDVSGCFLFLGKTKNNRLLLESIQSHSALAYWIDNWLMKSQFSGE